MASVTPSLRIAFTSQNFPTGTIPNGTNQLDCTWDDLLWAALTIGRPSLHHVLQHGLSSRYEAIFRASLLWMALEQSGPNAKRLRKTSAFKGLDPTEKGAVNYFLGMTFCKLFAAELLDTPWLLHLDIFGPSSGIANLGRSRPDLFGQATGSGAWHAFETKGRASKPSASDLAKAKLQATRLTSVGGTPCTLHIGSFSYFAGEILNFHWSDPPPDEKNGIAIPEIGDNWQYYYRPIWELWGREEAARNDRGGITIPIPEIDATIHIHHLLEPYLLVRAWAAAREQMDDHAKELAADGFRPDGLKVECGPGWSKRRSPILRIDEGSSRGRAF